MNIFIAGPMTNYPNYNFEAFDIARDRLHELGFTPISPADRDRAMGVHPNPEGEALSKKDRQQAVARCCKMIIFEADAIYMLNGWNTSVGAIGEKALAESLEMEVFYESVGFGDFKES